MSDPVALPIVLSRMTDALRRVATRLTDLEHAIGDIMLEAPSPRSRRFHALQEVDRARQEVADLAAFLDNIRTAASPEWRVDARRASRSLGLASLAAALACAEPAEALPGDCEHF